jgi:hypothetical protein
VRNRLREGINDLRSARRMYHFEYPFSPDAVVDFFRANYGPMSRAFASLDTAGQAKLRSALVQLWSENNRGVGNTTKVDAEYLEVVAMRIGNVDGAKKGGVRGAEDSVSRRARALADRIEEGAAALATFAEGLSEAEWNAVGSSAGTDKRSVGIVVHHVASVYPIEVDLAKAIAGGNAVTNVTWEAVAELNGKHAIEAASATKEATLELLRGNSKAAADMVRGFTDEELDRAAPFSLSYGAPVTAQFVIEDHALRHSWHHLAKIRKALGK